MIDQTRAWSYVSNLGLTLEEFWPHFLETVVDSDLDDMPQKGTFPNNIVSMGLLRTRKDDLKVHPSWAYQLTSTANSNQRYERGSFLGSLTCAFDTALTFTYLMDVWLTKRDQLPLREYKILPNYVQAERALLITRL